MVEPEMASPLIYMSEPKMPKMPETGMQCRVEQRGWRKDFS